MLRASPGGGNRADLSGRCPDYVLQVNELLRRAIRTPRGEPRGEERRLREAIWRHQMDVCGPAPTPATCGARPRAGRQIFVAIALNVRAPRQSPRRGHDVHGRSFPPSSREPTPAVRRQDCAWRREPEPPFQSSFPSSVLRILFNVRDQRTFRQPPEPGMTGPASGFCTSHVTNSPRSDSSQ